MKRLGVLIIGGITVIVNRMLRSVYFWVVIAGLALIFWLAKGNVSKVVKVIKLLGDLVVQLLTIFLGVFGIKFKKYLDEAGI